MPPKKSATIITNTLSRVEENRYKQSKKFIIGIDEAGRGPLAGPVVAASIICDNQSILDGIMDSKATKEEDREKLYEILINTPNIYWGVSIVSHTEIDEINILQASLAAMRRSTFDLLKKYPKKVDINKCIALIDGNKIPTDMPCESQYIIKGDSKIYSIAAASIIAKVTRDRIMLKLDKEYPVYNLAQHKGYPTFAHRQVKINFYIIFVLLYYHFSCSFCS
jgi:ribonuclease HII